MIEKFPIIKFKNGEIIKFKQTKRVMSGELTLQKFSHGFDLGSRTSIINHLIKKYNFEKYLEIGVRKGNNFKKIIAKHKTAVDPSPLFHSENLFQITSDEFFKRNKMKFDIIFLDGLHLEYQVDKDIINSLKVLKDDGMIIMHDCNPPTSFHQREKYEVNGTFPPWNGTVWKSFVKLRMKNSLLKLHCVDCDWGVGIITKGKSKLLDNIQHLDYTNLEKDRVNLLNLISVERFLELY